MPSNSAMQVAPKNTTLQTICEGIFDKWLGAGVVMPSGHTIAPGEPFATAGDILLDLPIHPVRPEKLVPGSPNSHAVWTLVPAPEDSPVWQLTGDLKGTRICGGTFRLPDHAFLLLSECSGLTLKDVSFIGGTVIVCGAESSVAFHQCHFHRCTVVVTGGAEASAEGCTHEASGIALFCCGSGTKVVSRGAVMRHCEQCACAADSAMLELHDAACSGPCITAFEARGDDTYLVMRGCTIKASRHVPRYMQPASPHECEDPPADPASPASDGTPTQHACEAAAGGASDAHDAADAGQLCSAGGGAEGGVRRQWAVCGVWGHSGARLDLSQCTVRKMAWGLWLDGPKTRAEVEGYRASGMRRGSMLAHNGATLVQVPPSA